jgi:hypothetical protein
MGGIFPFLEYGELRDRAGNVLMTPVPLTKFDGSNFDSQSGESYDATAHVTTRAAEYLVDKGNRRLEIRGTVYTVVSVIEHRFMGYLEVGLKRQSAS